MAAWHQQTAGTTVPDSLLGVPKGLSKAGEVRVEVRGRGDDFQEPRMDLCGEPRLGEDSVGVQPAWEHSRPASKGSQSRRPSSTSLLKHRPSPYFPSFNSPSPHKAAVLLGEAGAWLPSLQQPFLVACTHKALMFSVTADVYCGSVCGKTKYTLLSYHPKWSGGERGRSATFRCPHIQ